MSELPELNDLPELPLAPLQWGRTYTSSKDGEPIDGGDIASLSLYHVDDAEQALKAGRVEEAKQHYALAAEFARYVLSTLKPQKQPNSTGVYGLSAVIHFSKAGDFEKAAALVCELLKLSEEELPQPYRERLIGLTDPSRSHEITPSA